MVKLKELTWKDLFGYHKLDSEELEKFVENGFHIVSCDASYKGGVGTCSIQVRNGGKENVMKNFSFTASGPNEAEIKSIFYAIREVKNLKSVKKSLFVNDNYYAVSLVSGNFKPKQNNIIKSIEKVNLELSKLNIPYEFALVRGKVNRKVDKGARKYFNKKEKEIALNIQKRIDKVRKRISAGKYLKCIKTSETEFLVSSSTNSSYVVNLEDLYCTCPAWEKKWKNKGSLIIALRALPCKHMCRVADFSGLDVFEIFRKQIFRRR